MEIKYSKETEQHRMIRRVLTVFDGVDRTPRHVEDYITLETVMVLGDGKDLQKVSFMTDDLKDGAHFKYITVGGDQ